jgi:hypothetical protein
VGKLDVGHFRLDRGRLGLGRGELCLPAVYRAVRIQLDLGDHPIVAGVLGALLDDEPPEIELLDLDPVDIGSQGGKLGVVKIKFSHS